MPTLGANFNFIFYCLVYLAVHCQYAVTAQNLSWFSCLARDATEHIQILVTAIGESFDPQAALDLCKANGF